MKNIAKAILAVMQEVKGIEKNTTVGTGNYSYQGVNDQDVKKTIGESMQKNGLSLLPIEVHPTTHIDRWEETYNGNTKTKQSVLTEVQTKYLLLHESGESQVLAGYGHGVDAQDKGAGKATTYALKYALLYAFLVPTGKIDDADNTHSNEIPAPKAAQKQNSNTIPPEVLSEVSNNLAAIKNQEDLAALFKQYKTQVSQYPTLKGMFTNKKLALNGDA